MPEAAICSYCGAPIRSLVNGACPFCNTLVVQPAADGGAPVVVDARGPVWQVVLYETGKKKINVIKVVREATGLGLKEAKDLVERAHPALPVVVLDHLHGSQSLELTTALLQVGAVAEQQRMP